MKQIREIKIKIRVNLNGEGCHSQCAQLCGTDEGWVCLAFSRYVGETRVGSMRCEECKKDEIK